MVEKNCDRLKDHSININEIEKIFPEVWKILLNIDEKHKIFDNPDPFFSPLIFILIFQNLDKNLDEIKERLDFLNQLAGEKYMGDTKEFPEFLAVFHLYHYKLQQQNKEVD